MKKYLKKAVTFATIMTMAAVITTNAEEIGVWKQDSIGWWVEVDDSYLVNTWYKSPASGLWYYLGADGYVLTNTTTPDGYKVDENGVWIPETKKFSGKYSTYATIIKKFDLRDNVLTVSSERANDIEYAFSFSYPVAEDCAWVYGDIHTVFGVNGQYENIVVVTGEYSGSTTEDKVRAIKESIEGIQEYGDGDFGIKIEIVDGMVVKVCTVSS